MNPRCPITSITCFLCAISVGWAQPLDRDQFAETLEQLLESHPTAARTTVCLRVVDPAGGHVLFDRDGQRLLVPASNLKIYTTACALDQLGPERRFETRIRTNGIVRDGRLDGDVVLIGGGDPMFTTEQLAALADRLVSEWKIREVQGRVLVDNSRYGSRLKGPGWMWDDDPDYYNMSVTPFMLDFNVLRVRLSRTEGGAVSARLIPRADYPPLVPLPGGTASATPRIIREPFTAPIRYALPDTVREVEERITPHNPGRWIASVFEHMLQARGVHCAALASDQGTAEDDDAVAREIVCSGATLATAVRHFNRVSENAVGEVLLHELAVAAGEQPADWTAGARVISDWLVDTAQLEEGSFRLVDGSGLSRYNLISAESATRLLVFMLQHRHFDVFYDALPRYEVSIETIGWPEAPSGGAAADRIAAKPGGMTSVATISGYAHTLDGHRLVFSFLANGYIGSNEQVLDLRRKVFEVLVRYRKS